MGQGAVTDAAVRDLEAKVGGRVLGPGDEAYDQPRRIFNAMIDRYPALILRCASPEDVTQAVDFAREHGLALSI